MQNCRWQCQSRNSGNVGNTDRAGFGWKWETESSHSDPLKVNLTKAWAGISFVKACASEFVFENTPKWGEGVPSVSPPSEYFNSKNVSSSTSYSDSYFVFFSCWEKKRFPLRVFLLRFWSDGRPASPCFTPTAFSFPPIVRNDIGMPE